MYAHAARRRADLALTPHEVRVTRCEVVGSMIYTSVGVLSVVLAIVFRNGIGVVSAGFVYALLGVIIPLYWWRCGPSGEDCREAARA